MAAVGTLWHLMAPFGTLRHAVLYDILIIGQLGENSTQAACCSKEDTKSH